MTDGTGTTAYTYRPLGQLSALASATIDGPLITASRRLVWQSKSGLYLRQRV